MYKVAHIFLSILAVSFFFSACVSTPSRQVIRTDSERAIDLSGYWNDTDSRLVSEEMIRDLLSRPWIVNFIRRNNQTPTIIIGTVRNRSSEHIDVVSFLKDIERNLINSGRVGIVASAIEREEIRDERLDQQSEASIETMKAFGRESGADFILQGVLFSQTDAIDGQKIVFYQTDLELIDIETNQKIWIGSKEIKKAIIQNDFAW